MDKQTELLTKAVIELQTIMESLIVTVLAESSEDRSDQHLVKLAFLRETLGSSSSYIASSRVALMGSVES